jgi:hypothetical protein
MLVDRFTWKFSNSPHAPITRVRVPEGTVFPAVGVWQRVEAAGERIFTLDTTQSADGWLAWAIRGELLQAVPEDGIRPVARLDGKHYSLLIAYVCPGTAISVAAGYKRRRRLNVKILAPGKLCQAHADDFAEAETLLP